MTNRGYDDATGFGVRVGWTGRVSPSMTLGATYQTKTRMSEFDKYRGLFAEQGDFDIPENYGAGTANGAGFGWRNTTVYKIGFAYELLPGTTVRGGYVKLKQPIPASQTFFNILAPGVVEDHLTLGLTLEMSKTSELSVMYMHAFEEKVSGSGSIPGILAGGEANLRMSQNSVGVAYGWKY